MDFQLTAEQRELAAAVAEFATTKLGGEQPSKGFPADLWRRCAEFGLTGLAVPTDYGGSGLDALSVACAMEALGHACPHSGLLFSINAQMWACQHPILRFGTEEQKRRYLPGLCDGSLIAAHAMTETEAGSDAFGLRTRAEPRGDGWLLSGGKTFITNAPVADVFVAFATLDPARGFAGLCAFLVPRDTPGLAVGPPMPMPGLAGSQLAEVSFTSCPVGPDDLLGRPGGGMAVFNSAMRWERTLIMSCSVGAMRRQLDLSVAHAKGRKQFGRPVGDFQAVSHRLADMRVRLAAAELLTRRAAWALDRGDREADLCGAMAKLQVSEAYVASSLDALQIHGAAGLQSDAGMHRFLDDSVAARIYSGTSEILRNHIATKMGL